MPSAPRRAAHSSPTPLRAWLATVLSAVMLVSLAFSGVAAPWATGVEPDDTDRAAELVAAVEGSDTTVTTADGESGDATVEGPAAGDTAAEADGPVPGAQEAPVTEEGVEAPAGQPEVAANSGAEEPGAPVAPVVPRSVEAPRLAPMAVPAPTQGGAVINVDVRAYRTGATFPTGLKMRLHTATGNSTDSPGSALTQPWAICTTDAQGDCSFSIPASAVGQRYWVVPFNEPGNPSGYFWPATLVTGNNTSTGASRFAQTNYAFRTPLVSAGATVAMPNAAQMPSNTAVGNPNFPDAAIVSSSSRYTRRGSDMVVGLNNPRYQISCDANLKVALVIDLSTSMTNDSNAGLNGLRIAAKHFVRELDGTGTRVAMYTFGNSAGTALAPTLVGQGGLAVGTQSQFDSFTTQGGDSLYRRINSLSVSGTQYTNWDRGIAQAVNEDYDMAIILTDGNPTRHGNNQGNGSWTDLLRIEEAILSSNQLKAGGTQVLAFGVGAFLAGVEGDNIAAVSGLAEWTGSDLLNKDYAVTTDWNKVADQLESLAGTLNCSVPVKVHKTEIPVTGTARKGADWTFTAAKGQGNGTLTGAAAQTTGADGRVTGWTVGFTSPTGTQSLTLTETARPGWTMTDFSCTNNGKKFGTADLAGGTMTLSGVKVGDSVECEVTNTQTPASLVVEKTWVINGKTYTHEAAKSVLADYGVSAAPTVTPLPAGGTVASFGTTLTPYPVGTAVTVNETMSAGNECVVNSSEYVRDAGTVFKAIPAGGVTFPLAEGANSVTFRNTLTCGAELTLVKSVTNNDGGTAEAKDWTLTATGPTPVSGVSRVTSRVLPGTYSLAESAGPTGYAWADLSCIANGTKVTGVGVDNAKVKVAIGDKVTCTFTNDDARPELQLVKKVSGASQDLASNWTLTATGNGVALSGPGTTGPLTEVPGGVAITLAETRGDFPGAAEFTDGTAFSCVDTANHNASVDVAEDTITLVSGQQVVCTIVNTHGGASPTVTKTADHVTQNADGSWTTDYTVTVANPSTVVGLTYDVQDRLLFGGDITVTDATATGPGVRPEWNGATDVVLASGQALAAGASATYTVSVTATLDPGAATSTPGTLDCAADPTKRQAGGFLNAVDVLSGGAVVDSAEACLEPALPTMTKTVAAPVQLADGTWDVVYTLVVTGDSALDLHYDLSDTLGLDTDLVVNRATVSGPGNVDGWTGVAPHTALADGVLLAAGGAHTHIVTLNVTVPTSATVADVTCGPEGSQSATGTYNAATMTSSGQVVSDDACADIPLPSVELDKTVTGIEQLSNGLWRITYGIAVTNTDDVLATTYTLDDTLDFGDGLTPVTATWRLGDTALTGFWRDLPGNPTTNLATRLAIGAGVIHTYEVVVDASVAEGQALPAAAECTGDTGTAGGGFLNTAEVTFPGGTDDAADCAAPSVPDVTKTFVSAVQNDNGTWTVGYAIDVDNSGGLDSHYSLTDQPGFADGITVLDWTVTAAAGTPVVDPAIDGVAHVAPGAIATDRAIAADSIHRYDVVFTLRIPAGLSAEARECSAEGIPGSGLFNATMLHSGDQVRDDDDCAPVAEVGVPAVAKTVTGTIQNADGTWTVTYDVVVTSNADHVTSYTLTDTLRLGAGAVVDSAAWQWVDAPAGTDAAALTGSWTAPVADNPSTTIATDRVMPRGERVTHTYTVTVDVTVPQAAIDTTALDCTLAEGETGTGFLNEATLTSGAISTTVEDCSQPTRPGIEKHGADVSQLANGSWDVTYAITVDNSRGHAGVYDLADAPAFAPGITINHWSVEAGEDTPAVDPAISAAPFTDGSIASGRAVAAGATHTYEVRFNVAIPVTISAGTAECQPGDAAAGHGLFNEAVLTIADGTDRDDDCVGVPEIGTPTVAKTIGTVTQGADGRWNVTYTVTVTGHESQVTRYTLVDSLAFGAGATVESAAWAWDDAPDGAPAAWRGGSWTNPVAAGSSTVIATDRLLAPGADDTYSVTVVVDVAAGTIGTASMTCDDSAEGPAAGGFLNTVDLFVGDTLVDDADACGEPASPRFAKTVVGPGLIENADGSWDITYALTVTSGATAGQVLHYDLTDAPALPEQVELVDANITGTTPEGLVANPEWGADDATVARGVELTAGDEHVWTVRLTVRFTDAMTAAERDCELVEGEEGSGLVNTGQVTSGNDTFGDDVCVTIPDPSFALAKDVASAAQQSDGNWLVTYTVTVENTSSIPGTYLLTDTLDHGAGLTPVAATWALNGSDVSGAWDLSAGESTVLASQDRALAAGGSHVYTVTVVASVAAGESLPATAECTGEEGTDGGGFLNTVDLTFPGGSDDAAACAEPTVPTVSKSHQSLVQNDDATWTVTYHLVVDNGEGLSSVYSLADTPDFAEGTTVLDWTVAALAGTPEVTPAIDAAAWAAPGTIATATPIADGETHTYEVAFRVTIPAGISASVRECDAETSTGGRGLFNTVELTSGEQTRTDDDCAEIPEIGIPSVAKDVASVEQLADGTWRVSYDVVVTSNEVHHARYDLTDTIQFGGDAQVVSASWTWADAPESATDAEAAGEWGVPGENPSTTIATDRLIAAGAGDEAERHVYTVVVVASLSQAAIGTPAMDCELTDGEQGTGFLNSTTLTSGLSTDSDTDCAVPTEPVVSKHDAAVAQQPDASWNVTYEITVDNAGGHAGVYDLADVPDFAQGVTVNHWSVTASGGAPDPEIDAAAWTGGTIADGVAIAAGATHTYAVTFNVDVAVSIADDVRECSAGDDRRGRGFLNTAVLEIGDGSQSDDDCVDIPQPGIPTVGKTLGTVEQDADGRWNVTYQVVVTGDDEYLTRYDLVDDLHFGGGAQVLSAGWAWDDAPEGASEELGAGAWTDPVAQTATTLATARVLGVDETDTYTVTVLVELAAGTVGTPAMECAPGDDGEGATGFLNTVQLWVGDDLVDRDQACGEPAAPSFTKTAVDLTSGNDDTFLAVYDLRVSSSATAGQVVTYDLVDTPALPDQVELVARSASSDDVALDPAWNTGTTDVLVTGQTIGQGEEHVVRVTLTVRVVGAVPAELRTCEPAGDTPAGGLLNTGAVTSGSDTWTDEACLDLPAPEITVAKVIDEAVETEVGIWRASYTITVDNVSAVPGTYDLTDTLRYGEGITPTAGTWSREGGGQGVFDLSAGTSAVLADDQALEARERHVYTVVVTASVDPTMPVNEVVDGCEPVNGTGGSGFLNQASLGWDDTISTVDACEILDVTYGALEVTKVLAGHTGAWTGGTAPTFEMVWECVTPAGETLGGRVLVSAGESRLLSGAVPVGSRCTVVEEAPHGSLATGYGWADPSYSAGAVTLTVAVPDVEVLVTNTIVADGATPLLPSTGAGDRAGLAWTLLVLLGAVALAAAGARRETTTA